MGFTDFRIKEDSWNYVKDLLFYYRSFNLYAERIDLFIKEDLAKEQEIYEKYNKDPEVVHNGGEIFNYEMDVKTSETLVDIYYDSFIMAMYSFTEKKMFFLCNYLSRKYKIDVDDISGKGIFKYRKYLNKVCDIDFTPIEGAWNNLSKFNQLRNHLVHAEGNRIIPRSKQALIDILKELPEVEVAEEADGYKFHFTGHASLYRLLGSSQAIIDYLYQERPQPSIIETSEI